MVNRMRRTQGSLVLAALLPLAAAACGPAPDTLAARRHGVRHPYGLAQDADRLYWTERAAGGAIRTCRKDGSDLRTLATGVAKYAFFCAVDDAHVYWTEFDTGLLRRVPKAGGAAEDWESGLENPGQLDIADGTVWWVEYGGGRIRRRRTDAGRAAVALSGLEAPQALRVDRGRVWWTEAGDPGMLKCRSVAGGRVTAIARVLPECWLVPAGRRMFWTETGGRVRSVGRDGRGAVESFDEIPTGGAYAAAGGGWVWWAEEFGGTLRRLPAGGGPAETVLAGLRHPGVLVADDRAVYWTDPEAHAILRFVSPPAGGSPTPR